MTDGTSQGGLGDRERAIAHVLIDMMVAWDPDNPEDHGPPALASERIREIDAVSAAYDDQTGEVNIDLGPLLGASGFLIYLLVGGLARKYENLGPLDILAHLRSQVDDSV